MNNLKGQVLSTTIISLLLILVTLFTSSCFFNPDKAVNIRDCVTDKIVVKTNSTEFYFYYDSEEHPIEEYGLIKVEVDYYVDYTTSMKKKDFFIEVSKDVKYEEQPYFVVEIDDALTNQSVVYLSVHANYKAHQASTNWSYVISIIIAIVMFLILCPLYTMFSDALSSNSLVPSLLWTGSIIIYVVVAIIVGSLWGTGASGFIFGSGVLYFIITLLTYYRYKQ